MSQVYDELAALSADLHAWLDWAQLTGQQALPRERVERLSAEALAAPRDAPAGRERQIRPRVSPARPAAPPAQSTPSALPSKVQSPSEKRASASAKWTALMDAPATHTTSGPVDAPLLVIRGSGSSDTAEQMLDRMLENVVGTSRAGVAIVDLIRDGRSPQDIGAGVKLALDGFSPQVVLLMGTFAAQALFSGEDTVSSSRGEWRTLSWGGGQADTRVTHHPEAILALAARGEHTPKRETFEDLQAIAARLSRA